MTWVIGTASTARSGHSPRHISRATPPWRRLTPFAARLIRRLNVVIAEGLCAIVGALTAESHDHLGIDAQLRPRDPRACRSRLAGVGLVAGRDGRVRREHRALPGGRKRGVHRRAARDLAARQLERRERRMPLV